MTLVYFLPSIKFLREMLFDFLHFALSYNKSGDYYITCILTYNQMNYSNVFAQQTNKTNAKTL